MWQLTNKQYAQSTIWDVNNELQMLIFEENVVYKLYWLGK